MATPASLPSGVRVPFILPYGNAFIGVGTETPEAFLDIVSNQSGILVPRLTQEQIDANVPVNSEIHFNLTKNRFEWYKGSISEWLPFGLNSLQEMWDNNPDNTTIISGDFKVTVDPSIVKVENTDTGASTLMELGSVRVTNADKTGDISESGANFNDDVTLKHVGISLNAGFEISNDDGSALVITKATNITDNYIIENAILPNGTYTPAYSVNGTMADDEGNIALDIPDTSGFVQNPMVTDLNAGDNNITNVQDISSNTGNFNNVISTLFNGEPLPTQYTTEEAQDAVGAMVNSTLVYNDATPSLGRAAITGDISIPTGSNTATLPDVNGDTGTLGSAPNTLVIGANAKGQITAVNVTPIQIAESQVTNLTTDLAAKAPLASPALTGAPTAPTAAANTNSTQLATTAYADAKVQNSLSASTTVAPSATAVNTAISAIRMAHVEFKGSAIANPVDATTYYLSQTNNTVPSTTSGRTIAAPITATFVNWSLNSTTGGGASSEGMTVSIRNVTTGATAVVLTSSFLSNAAASSTNTLAGTTSFSCSQGDKIECFITTPTWATNPTNMILNFFITFQS